MNYGLKITKEKCDYCGEKKPMKIITDPNHPEDKPFATWEVCLICESVIHWQQQLSMGFLLDRMVGGSEETQKMIKEAQERLEQITKESGIPISSVIIEKEKP